MPPSVGELGVLHAGVATPFLMRHKAPIVEVMWQQHVGAEGPEGGATLHSLCAAGCLLRWGTPNDKVRSASASSRTSRLTAHLPGGCEAPAASRGAATPCALLTVSCAGTARLWGVPQPLITLVLLSQCSFTVLPDECCCSGSGAHKMSLFELR